jgi:hypothetical protein
VARCRGQREPKRIEKKKASPLSVCPSLQSSDSRFYVVLYAIAAASYYSHRLITPMIHALSPYGQCTSRGDSHNDANDQRKHATMMTL